MRTEGLSTAALLPEQRGPRDHGRTKWLDGVRFAAAMFVVVHHCWLLVFPGFPRNNGPFYLGWMLYGHLAVVVFIVVSGYSLTLAPAKNGFRLKGGAKTFARRRAWRILPPYWAALIFSMPVFALVTDPGTRVSTLTKAFFVHGLLLQDVIGSPSPNGAFWSIAVEAQIYILFPLMLYLRRSRGPVHVVIVVTAVTCGLEVLAHNVGALARYDDLTPQLLVDFALGMAAANSMKAVTWKGRRVPMLGIGAIMCVGCIVVMNRLGSQEVVKQFFSADIVVGVVTAIVFRGIASADHGRVRAFFECRPMVAGGRFSYSIYLVHALVLSIVLHYVVDPLRWSGLSSLCLLLALVVPAALLVSYAFFVVFERPFLTIRSIDALAQWAKVRPPAVRDQAVSHRPDRPKLRDAGG